MINKDIIAQFIPLRKVLKLFFELPGKRKVQQNYEIFVNVVEGSFRDTIRIPLECYSDNYDNNNPLGSHKRIDKCGAVYINIGILPPEVRAKVDNIFLFMLCNNKHRTKFSNKIVYRKVIEELQFLKREGITVIIDNKPKKIYFDLLLLLGDNLGLVESFSANLFCRFCLTERQNINTIFNERDCTLRDETNHATFLAENDVSLSGIKEPCVFNEVDDFHVVKNLAADIPHDWTEGVHRYDFAKLLNYFIFEAKYFTLDDLNLRLPAYQYGVDDHFNKPPPISEKHLKNGCIIISSSEMMNLLRCLFLIVGPLVSEGHPYWELLIKLKTVTEIVFSKVIHKNTYRLLETEIMEYLISLSKLFPNLMRPKHHFAIHYPRIMKAIGPLPQIGSMRNESKHRDGKVTSHVAI